MAWLGDASHLCRLAPTFSESRLASTRSESRLASTFSESRLASTFSGSRLASTFVGGLKGDHKQAVVADSKADVLVCLLACMASISTAGGGAPSPRLCAHLHRRRLQAWSRRRPTTECTRCSGAALQANRCCRNQGCATDHGSTIYYKSTARMEYIHDGGSFGGLQRQAVLLAHLAPSPCAGGHGTVQPSFADELRSRAWLCVWKIEN